MGGFFNSIAERKRQQEDKTFKKIIFGADGGYFSSEDVFADQFSNANEVRLHSLYMKAVVLKDKLNKLKDCKLSGGQVLELEKIIKGELNATEK